MSRPDYMKQIENRILSMPVGAVFITSDFLDLADTPSVNKALSRLAVDGTIHRVVRGVYDRPRFSEQLQEYVEPSVGQIAKMIARNFGSRIVPCGDTALNLLDLQVALDYFDASINRISAWVTGYRNVQKALLFALLQPNDELKAMQDRGDFTKLMVAQEELKTAPFGEVWDEYCRRCGKPVDGVWYSEVEEYETKVLVNRV